MKKRVEPMLQTMPPSPKADDDLPTVMFDGKEWSVMGITVTREEAAEHLELGAAFWRRV